LRICSYQLQNKPKHSNQSVFQSKIVYKETSVFPEGNEILFMGELNEDQMYGKNETKGETMTLNQRLHYKWEKTWRFFF
jgi:hypothetical protein